MFTPKAAGSSLLAGRRPGSRYAIDKWKGSANKVLVGYITYLDLGMLWTWLGRKAAVNSIQDVDFNLGLLLLGRKVVDEIDIILFLYGRKLIMNDNIIGQIHHWVETNEDLTTC